MLKSKVLLATDSLSKKQQYGLDLEETKSLLDDAVMVASQVFESAVVFVVISEVNYALCNKKNFDLPTEQLAALFDWVSQADGTIQIDEFSSFKGLNREVDKHLPVSTKHLIGTSLTVDESDHLGGLFVCAAQEEPFSSAQETVLRILAKDIVTQLKLRKQNNDLVNLAELYELITETNQDLIFAKDKDFKLVLANRNFINLYPPEMRDKVIGYTTLESYPEEEARDFLQNDVIAFETGRSEVIEKITFPSGKIRTINTVKTRFELMSGEPYILGVSQDITEKEQLIAQLTKSNNDLDEFAYVASHDLKSPLNAIKRLVSFIEEDAADQFDALSQKHFDLIKSRADRMLRLLSDLLSFARIGRDVQAFQDLDLKETVASCCELIDIPEAFQIHVDSQQVVLPRIPLELVLTNLISNAIKHHHKQDGNIWVASCTLPSHYKITVTDDGPGIDESMFEKIFEKFQTLKPRDQVEGSGLGLSMVEKTLSHYRGNVSVSCPNDVGTQFTLMWPRERS